MKNSGGYRQLRSYQNATVIYDFTQQFCQKYISKFSRTKDQMEQAARSGKQNIAEGSVSSATSKMTEIRLVNVARASLAELLADYEDFLRQSHLPQWPKEDPRSQEVRALSYKTYMSYTTYMSYMNAPEPSANCAICLIYQTLYLLDRQIQSLDKSLVEDGGYQENMYRRRELKRSQT